MISSSTTSKAPSFAGSNRRQPKILRPLPLIMLIGLFTLIVAGQYLAPRSDEGLQITSSRGVNSIVEVGDPTAELRLSLKNSENRFYSYDVTIDQLPSVSDTIDNAAAVDKGGGLVGIPVTGHGFATVGAFVTIAGSINYNDSYAIISETANAWKVEIPLSDSLPLPSKRIISRN